MKLEEKEITEKTTGWGIYNNTTQICKALLKRQRGNSGPRRTRRNSIILYSFYVWQRVKHWKSSLRLSSFRKLLKLRRKDPICTPEGRVMNYQGVPTRWLYQNHLTTLTSTDSQTYCIRILGRWVQEPPPADFEAARTRSFVLSQWTGSREGPLGMASESGN